jgi:hypothetical protein
MIAAQEKFGDALDEGRQECNGYVNDMTSLRNSLSGDFKNLAFLQVRIGAVDCSSLFCAWNYARSCFAAL